MYTGSGCFPGKIFSDTYIIFYLESDEFIEARVKSPPGWNSMRSPTVMYYELLWEMYAVDILTA